MTPQAGVDAGVEEELLPDDSDDELLDDELLDEDLSDEEEEEEELFADDESPEPEPFDRLSVR